MDWNERVSYERNPQKKRWRLQELFLQTIETDQVLRKIEPNFPEVLLGLKERVYEKWQTAATCIYQGRTPEDRAAGVDRLTVWNHVETTDSPECRAAKAALDKWAERLNVRCPWELNAAIDTMRFWSVPAQEGVNAEGEADSEPIPVNEIKRSLEWDFASFHELGGDALNRDPLEAWDPEEETLVEFRGRIEQ